jgi:hypothetical protein
MISRRHQRPVDDPRMTSIEVGWRGEHERSEAPHDVGDDAMRLRGRDAEHRGELAHGEVGP